MTSKTIIAWAGFLGLTAVAFGALGAHALKSILEPESLKAFETGVRYQTIHALGLLVVGLNTEKIKFSSAIAWTWLLGVLFFSGSILLLSTSTATGFQVSFLGPVTPIGGLLLITGWLLILISALNKKNQTE